MDVVVCGAPLDSSFQKDKLELVNKGSLGRRRKPSRSNLKLLLAPSNSTPQPSTPTPQPSTPTPTLCSKKPLVNGHVHKERLSPQSFKPPPRIESSLPRTWSQPNHVADAQQFSIEAKLKRKKSDVGRSAVLIQTWERRTRNDSLPKRHQAGKNCNRFQNKENIRQTDDMPDSHVYSKYAENSVNVESLKNGGLVSKVRDAYSEDTMLYRMSENGSRCENYTQMNGNEKPINNQEPEWISLSRKLCAKFVEGHIEHNSADSYLHEEPDGVKQQVVKLLPPSEEKKETSEPPQRVDMKKKVVDSAALTEENQSVQPPWIHLSRKLCTKFIEEHIEYPFVTPDRTVKEVSVAEPNGDIRIIEKIGKPKGRKSRVRKESEPEWVSLSRKLRAKFIETHIDDPETISLDNQLNASDPEENSSESLSDTSHEVVIPKKVYEVPKDSMQRGCNSKNETFQVIPNACTNNFHSKEDNFKPDTEKECSWEYQELEFDQEDSDTFQEQDCFEDPYKVPGRNKQDNFAIKIHSGAHNVIHPQKMDCPKFTSFAETVNSYIVPNAERCNNDVLFAPCSKTIEKPPSEDRNINRKVITVQFVSHREKVPQKFQQVEQSVQTQAEDFSEKSNNNNCSFFNLTTWEEAHYKSDDDRAERICNHQSNSALMKEWKSKSMENIFDQRFSGEVNNKYEGRENSHPLNNVFSLNENQLYKSEDVLDKLECSTFHHNVSDNSNGNQSGNCKERENHSRLKCNGYSSQNRFVVSEASENDISVNHEDNKHTRSNSEHHKNGNCLKGDSFRGEKIESGRHIVSEKEDLFDSCDYKHEENSTEHCKTSENKTALSSDTFETDVNKEDKHKILGNGSDLRTDNYKSSENNFETNIFNENGMSLNSNSVKPQNNMSSTFETSKIDASLDFDGNRSNCKGLKNCGTSRDNSFSQQSFRDSNTSNDSSQFETADHGISTKSKHKTKNKNNDNRNESKSNYKCNGFIPNSKEVASNKSSVSKEFKREERKVSNNSYLEMHNSLMGKDLSNSKSADNVTTNEYANINPSISCTQLNKRDDSFETCKKYKSAVSVHHSDTDDQSCDERIQNSRPRRNTSDGMYEEFGKMNAGAESPVPNGTNLNSNDVSLESKSSKVKSKSCMDISGNNNFIHHEDDFQKEVKQNGIGSQSKMKSKSMCSSTIQFQEFESEADIPLCAKLVSKQNGKRSNRSVSSSSNRNISPCSESSHVYEDMFKDTTSCPSDSETSSWTVMKNNSYYVNGRSSSMNDLDYSDSCSMSVKCDYASSCSEQSTLQSRHSSYTSSSFYVNLRDYDSHMLEPSLSRKKKDHKKATKNGNATKILNSNPPTPESLRHLFTSPLNSIHSPPNRATRLVSRLPQEPESHYYSTAAATSSAFKHGFDPTPPKPKKTERSSSIKIKDIAHGIILTFRRFQNHSKTSHVSPTHYVDVSHLAEFGSKANNSESSKSRSKKEQKEVSKKPDEKKRWGFSSENGRTDSDSGCPSSEVQRAKARRSSSDLAIRKPNLEIMNADKMLSRNGEVHEKKKGKSGKKNSNAREKGKKSRSKSLETKTIPTVTRKVQQMADGTLYLVTTVSGDTALPGVYSDSPDTSSELSSHRPVKMAGESNC